MLRRVVVLALLGGAVALPSDAFAADPPPGAVISDSLDYVNRLPGKGNVEGKLDRVRGQNILVTTGTFGFRTYDVSDPANPRQIGSYLPPEVIGPNGYWQDEDMDIDRRRKLIIGALDPRHDNVDQTSCPGIGTISAKTRNPKCKSGFYVISYADPANLKQIAFVELPVGHTASCIDDCRYIWTGGPARRDDLPALYPGVWTAFTPGGRGDGRPIWVTDLRNPTQPKVFPNPIDLYRNDGATDYSHDVQVDKAGFAWVSGRGGITGYATKGRWTDPYTGRKRQAQPWDPVLVAGGGVGGVNQPGTDFMHNSIRPVDGSSQAAGVPKGNVLIGTEEDFTEPCDKMGRIVLSDITDSLGGVPAATSTPEKPYRMKALDTFHPLQDTPETADPSSLECSAHYFELQDSVLAGAWYGQGLRLVDVSNARDVRQIGYYRVTGTDPETNPTSLSWDTAWNGRYIYLFDMDRGIEVLKLKRGTKAEEVRGFPSVTAPSKGKDRFAPKPVSSLEEGGKLICPLFADATSS
jgi:hypothetical protein